MVRLTIEVVDPGRQLVPFFLGPEEFGRSEPDQFLPRRFESQITKEDLAGRDIGRGQSDLVPIDPHAGPAPVQPQPVEPARM